VQALKWKGLIMKRLLGFAREILLSLIFFCIKIVLLVEHYFSNIWDIFVLKSL